MKKKWFACLAVVGFSLVMSISSFANDRIDYMMDTLENSAETNDDGIAERSLVPEISARRGEVISFIEAGLRDMGLGVAHVSGEVACHHPVEAIHIRLMLQKWNEEHQEWATVNRQDFEWNAEDLPEGEDLTYAYISYNIPGCESGETYRTKGIFGAWDDEFDDAWIGYSGGIEF